MTLIITVSFRDGAVRKDRAAGVEIVKKIFGAVVSQALAISELACLRSSTRTELLKRAVTKTDTDKPLKKLT